MISFNNSCLECKSIYNKSYFGICCKSLALAFGTTFAIYMVRALLMFHLKEKLMSQHSREVGIDELPQLASGGVGDDPTALIEGSWAPSPGTQKCGQDQQMQRSLEVELERE